MALRGQLKAIKLAAEKLQQLALAALPLPPGNRALPAVAANLRRYFGAIDCAMDEPVRERLLVILRAAFPRERGPDPETLVRGLANG